MTDPIIDAIRTENLEQLARCLTPEMLDKRDSYGYTPLIHTVIANKPHVATWLLAQGAAVDAYDMLGWTPLQWAADDHNLPFCQLLLQAGANPNHFAADGQPVLAFPVLREQTDIINLFLQYDADLNFALDFITSKTIGHRFDLSGKAHIVNPSEEFVRFNLEGFFFEATLGLIEDSLQRFLQHPVSERFTKYQTPLLKTLNHLKLSTKLVQRKYTREISEHKKVILDVIQQDLLIIPITFSGHAVTIVKYGHLLALCDRGGAQIEDTVFIYKIGNPYTFTHDFLFDLLYKNKNVEYVHTDIKQDLALTPLTTLPATTQVTGNCSWANVEAAIPAALFMLTFRPDRDINVETYNLRRSVMACFDLWVEWDRDFMLEEYLQAYDRAQYLRKASHALILSIILEQHCKADNPRHLERARKITTALQHPDYAKILLEFFQLAQMPGNPQGENFLRLMQVCGITSKHLKQIMKSPIVVSSKSPGLALKIVHLLNIAAETGHKTLLEVLLKRYNIQGDVVDTQGNTPLMYAAWRNNIDIVRTLIEDYGFDHKSRNHKGATALDYAEHSLAQEVIQYLSLR